MSTATCVRETWNLTGDDAWRTLAATGRYKLVRDAFVRLRAADGFSHSRSLAYATSLVFVQGLIALVGLAVELGQTGFNRTILGAIENAVPGPAGSLLVRVFAHAQQFALEHRFLPLLFGLAGTLVTATTATAQLIRGINRLYGIEKDEPFINKYARALLLAILLLAAFIVAGTMLTVGRRLSGDVGGHATHIAWHAIRWPVALALAAAAFGGILRWAPHRRQPHWSWLVFGGVIGVAGWTLVTVLFGLAFRASSSFSDVYGSLAGVVALQIWTFLSSVAIFFGAAIAAQLEAVRSGTQPPTGA
jgi:YihY family inner membrane protein